MRMRFRLQTGVMLDAVDRLTLTYLTKPGGSCPSSFLGQSRFHHMCDIARQRMCAWLLEALLVPLVDYIDSLRSLTRRVL